MGLEWEFLSGPLRTIVFGAVVAPRRKTTSLTLYWALGGGFAKAPRLTPSPIKPSKTSCVSQVVSAMPSPMR